MSEQFSGTMPVAGRHSFDAGALGVWMQQHVAGYAGMPAIEQFKGGQSNPTYRLEAGGRRYVMRSKPAPAAKLLPSAHAVEREYRVMGALAGAGIPVPRMLALCEDEAVIGRAFYIMDCVEGRVFWEQSLPGMDKAGRAAIYDEMNRVIAALHAVDYAAAGLADFGKPGNYFARQVARWTRQYQASETERIEAMDSLIAWLPQHIPAGDETAVVHGDYRMDNLIFHKNQLRFLGH